MQEAKQEKNDIIASLSAEISAGRTSANSEMYKAAHIKAKIAISDEQGFFIRSTKDGIQGKYYCIIIQHEEYTETLPSGKVVSQGVREAEKKTRTVTLSRAEAKMVYAYYFG